MTTQRRLNSTYTDKIGPDGAPKKTQTGFAPAAPGMKRATLGDLAAYHHGVSVNDEPNTAKTYTGSIPVHPGMKQSSEGGSHDPSLSNKVLQEAANLGRKT